MGDINQLLFFRQFAPDVKGPILEIGSKDYGNTSSLRDVFPHNEYVGVDLEAGKGVDVIVDLANGIGNLKENYFGCGICCSVMEHVPTPWTMAENITRLIAKDGLLFISVPWVWRYHMYPDDYFRFSFRGITSLFPEFEWDTPYYSTTVPGEFIAITEENKGADANMAMYITIGPGKVKRVLRRLIGKKNTKALRKYLPYLMVNMIGRKK